MIPRGGRADRVFPDISSTVQNFVTDPSDNIERSVASMTASWLQRAGKGDPNAWTRLESTYRALVCWWCGKSGIPSQDIDDVTQDVFAAIAKALASFEHKSFRGFLWTITRNKIQDYWRKRKKQPTAQGGTTIQKILANVEAESSRRLGSVDTATKILFDEVVALVQREFTNSQWNAFWQVTVEGKEPADVARELGITRNQVYLAKSRILRRIRSEFDGTPEANAFTKREDSI